MRPKRALPAGAILAFLSLPAAEAQELVGAIVGVVRDETGAVLPGVSVETMSPALMGGDQTTTTDASGNYRLLRLPVGEYSVTYTLSGFTTAKRSGILVHAGFTATVNVSLSVGSIEETVTVAGESPVIDVKRTVAQAVLTDDIIATIPTARSVFDMTKLILGVSTARPDVGGSNSVFYTDTQVHGSIANDRAYYNDGVKVGVYFSGGDAPRYYGSVGAQEEVGYLFSAIPAEVANGGIAFNMVTRDGGNDISGNLFASGANDSMQSSNLDEELQRRGVRATSGMQKIYDLDFSGGGPIFPDRVWFFGSGRVWAVDQLLANQFNRDGSQASNFDRNSEHLFKVTWQAHPQHKLSTKYQHDGSFRPYRRQGAQFVEPEAAAFNRLRYSDLFLTRYTGTIGAAWILEGAFGYARSSAARQFRPETQPGAVARLDIVTSTLSGAPLPDVIKFDRPEKYSVIFTATRLANWKGTHELKFGTQNHFANYRDTFENEGHGDITLRFANGVPNSVDLFNTPVDSIPEVKEIGFFVQDSWTIANRLTLNLGLRYDQFRLDIAEQFAPAGTWVPERRFPRIPEVVNWRNLVPRAGVSYDLFGTGKTVLKASFSRYMGVEGISAAERVNPMFVSTNRCAWTDMNGDRLAQPGELSRCSGFVGGVSTTIDPDLERPFNNEFTLGVQHELMPNWSVSLMYFRRENRDLRGIRNDAVPTSGYLPVAINNPLDGAPLTIYNQDPATLGRQQNVLANDGRLESNYNGIEFSLQRRFSSRASLIAGYHYGKVIGSILPFNTQVGAGTDLNDPNNFIFHEGAVGNDEPHQFKLSGHYLLPWDVSVSGVFLAYSGHPRARTLVVSRALVPNLTRPSQTVRLERNDVNRYDSIALLDLRLSRIFVLAGDARLEPFADFYNIFNVNTVLQEVTTVGASLGRISATVNPRIVRVGVKFNF